MRAEIFKNQQKSRKKKLCKFPRKANQKTKDKGFRGEIQEAEKKGNHQPIQENFPKLKDTSFQIKMVHQMPNPKP